MSRQLSNVKVKLPICYEYRGESTISYGEGLPPVGGPAKSPAAELTSLPAGLELSIELTAAIDAKTAAAGAASPQPSTLRCGTRGRGCWRQRGLLWKAAC